MTKAYYGQTSVGETMALLKPGLPLGAFYGYVSKGVNPETGDLIYQTKNSNGIPSLSERQVIGDPNPKFNYGMTNNFSYMGFSFNVFLQGSFGNDIYNVSRMETEGMYDAKKSIYCGSISLGTPRYDHVYATGNSGKNQSFIIDPICRRWQLFTIKKSDFILQF